MAKHINLKEECRVGPSPQKEAAKIDIFHVKMLIMKLRPCNFEFRDEHQDQLQNRAKYLVNAQEISFVPSHADCDQHTSLGGLSG